MDWAYEEVNQLEDTDIWDNTPDLTPIHNQSVAKDSTGTIKKSFKNSRTNDHQVNADLNTSMSTDRQKYELFINLPEVRERITPTLFPRNKILDNLLMKKTGSLQVINRG